MTNTGSEPDALACEPVASPNPLGTNAIKLTLPTRRRPKPAENSQQTSATPPAADAEISGAADQQASTTDAPADVPDDDSCVPTGYGLDRHITRVLGVLVAIVAVIVGLVWWFAQPEPKPKPVHRIADQRTGGPPATKTVAPINQDGPLQVTLTAVCPGQSDPKLAASDDHHSGWTCPTGGVPFGQKLVATLPQPTVIDGIEFWPGFNGTGPDGRDEWFRHLLLQEVSCQFNDRDLTELPGLPNGERQQYKMVVDHLVASQVECTVKSTVPPPPQPAATPTSVPPGADPTAAEAPPGLSSILPPDPLENPDGSNAPNASSIAVTGFHLIGHAIR